jgi:hypothetical protein
MHTYNIKLVSQTNSAVFMLIALPAIIISRYLFFPKELSVNYSIAFGVVTTLTLYLLWQKFVVSKTEWSINDNEITIIPKKKIFSLKNINLKWSDIKEINSAFHPFYYWLRIKLNSGETSNFFISRTNSRDRDDCVNLVVALNQAMNEYKKDIAKP